jgi:hypothetical protein
VTSPGTPDTTLHGAQCPALWIDLPNLLTRPTKTYRTSEPVKILRIGTTGIVQLEREQRLRLLQALENY